MDQIINRARQIIETYIVQGNKNISRSWNNVAVKGRLLSYACLYISTTLDPIPFL
jgi:hypothetical protein